MSWEHQLDALARELGISTDEPQPEPLPVMAAELVEDNWEHQHGTDCCCWPDHCFEPE